MIEANQNNEAAVPLTPNLPKVQPPYFFKDVIFMGHRKLLCTDTVIWRLEDGIQVT